MSTAARQTGRYAIAFLGAHTRSITAAVVVVLAGFGATAFGIAPMVAPEPAAVPSRIVSEGVMPDDIATQLEALAIHRVSLYRSETTRSGDTADSLLKRLGVVDAEAAAFLREDPAARQVFTGRSGKSVQASVDEEGRFNEMVVRFAPDDTRLAASHFTRLTIRRAAGGVPARFESRVEVAELQVRQRLGSGTIRHSLFAAADGELIGWNPGAGRVLAAEFVNDGVTHSAVWFADTAASGAAARGAYYDMRGQNKRRSFLASPLEFSRVTSGFAMRLHPILRTWRQHKGVDYGAPTGTPVRTVGDGVIEFAGRQGGYGNVVKVRHSNNRTTVYAHLSRVDVRIGERVEQGDTIGTVGATGWATGPHLHFEFIIGDDHVDPMIVARSSETDEVTAAARPVFNRMVASIRSQLDLAQTASRQTEYAE